MVLGDGQRDPLDRPQLEVALPQLGAEARVGAQSRWRTGQHAEEVRKLAPGRQRSLEDGNRALGGGELVVDVEPAHRGLHANNQSASIGARSCRRLYFLRTSYGW
jgi:hypothetical protein